MRKTLFMSAQNPMAVLVTTSGKRRWKRLMQFATPHAALDWCLASQAAFVFTPGAANPKLN